MLLPVSEQAAAGLGALAFPDSPASPLHLGPSGLGRGWLAHCQACYEELPGVKGLGAVRLSPRLSAARRSAQGLRPVLSPDSAPGKQLCSHHDFSRDAQRPCAWASPLRANFEPNTCREVQSALHSRVTAGAAQPLREEAQPCFSPTRRLTTGKPARLQDLSSVPAVPDPAQRARLGSRAIPAQTLSSQLGLPLLLLPAPLSCLPLHSR